MKQKLISKAGALLIVMVLALTAGCGGANQPADTTAASAAQTTATAGEETTAVEEFTVDWFVNVSSWAYGATLPWGENLVTSEIKKRTGANVNFIVAASDTGEQLSTMVAANSLPDIITFKGLWDNNDTLLISQLAQEGFLQSYNEMGRMSPGLMEACRQDVFDWFKESDGNTYVYPCFAYSEKDKAKNVRSAVPNRAITMRKDLWEAIGSPDVTTPEGFLAACKKAMDQLKTYNGQNLTGLQLYEGGNEVLSIMNQYFATPREYQDGKKAYDFDMPQNKEALAFLNEAFRMGLITEANFSDTREMINEKVASGRVFAMITAPQDFAVQFTSLYEADNNAVYFTPALRNHAGEEPVLSDSSGWGYLVTGATKNAKRPDLVAKLFELLISDEGQLLMLYGVEGETFEYNSDRTLVDYTQKVKDDIAAGNTDQYGFNCVYLFQNVSYLFGLQAIESDDKSLVLNDYHMKKSLIPYTYNFASADGKEDPADPRKTDMAKIGSEINNYRRTAVAELITAPNTDAFEAKYREVLDTLKDMGVDKLKEYSNEVFQKGKENLGVKYIWPPYLK